MNAQLKPFTLCESHPLEAGFQLSISDLHVAPEDWECLRVLANRRERVVAPIFSDGGVSVRVIARAQRRRMAEHPFYDSLSFAFWRVMMYAERQGYDRVHIGAGNPIHDDIPRAIGRYFVQGDVPLR